MSYLPITPVSFYNDSMLLYKFEENTLLNSNNFGEIPQRDTIELKNINLGSIKNELILKYKKIGDTIYQYHQIHIID